MKLYNYLNFKDVYESIKDISFPFKTSYKFTKILLRADEENAFYNSELNKLFLEYADGPQDENGNIPIKKGCERELEIKINELLNTDVIPCEIKFTLEELDGLNFNINQMNSLMPFIEE